MRQVTIDGRLGKDAVVSSSNGKQYIKFSIANTLFKNGKEETEWFDITSFDDFVINKKVKALTKGSYVIVTGEWETETNVSQKTNQLYINHRVIANAVNIPNVGKKLEETANKVATPSVSTPEVNIPTINIPNTEKKLNSQPVASVAVQDDFTKDVDDELPF
jgi:single-stranded DNA-binding protein